MAPYLEEHPPDRSQYRKPRRATPSGVVVVHTAENTPDTIGADAGAEAVANFIVHRDDPGSYHDLADSDSLINLVAYDAEAFHDGTGSNPHSYGVSGATRADRWVTLSASWRDGCVRNMAAGAARYATWLANTRGIVIPARRITRYESELRVPGFISHAERDPARRTDPGPAFPWDDFFAYYIQFTIPATPPPPAIPEDDYMPMPVLFVPGDTEGRAAFTVFDRPNKEIIRMIDIPDANVTAAERYDAGVMAGLYTWPPKEVDRDTFDRAAIECQGTGEKHGDPPQGVPAADPV